MITRISSICLVVLISIANLPGQDSLNAQNNFPAGITLEYGIGSYSVTDEYISKEKYSGTLPWFSVSWVKVHNDYIYRLDMSYRNSNEINNFNVSTDITQFTLNQGFLYPIGDISIFQKSLYLWLGPTTEFFFYNNDQNIAVSGFDYAQSEAGLISLGCDIEGIYAVNSGFFLESSLNFTLLSLGFRSVDDEEDDQSNVKFLTLFSGLNLSFDIGIL